MLKLKKADYPGNYHGFSLKENYWYGQDMETGKTIATSGWECNGCVAIYFLTDHKWEMEWINISDTDFTLENIPEVNTKNKLPFNQWLETEIGISWNEYDNNYSGMQAKQIEEEYLSYYYDDLPQFVIKYM